MRRWWTWIAIVAASACTNEAEDSLVLTRLATFTDSLAQVRGAAFGEAGSIYVADAVMKAVYRIDDSTTRNLFPNGMGPGEVMQPVDVSYVHTILSVLDGGRGGTSTFSGGEFLTFRPEDFGPNTRFATGTDEIENPLSHLELTETQTGSPVPKLQTNSCRAGDRTHQMSLVAGTTLVMQGEELHSTDDAVIVPLGIACSDELVVLGYATAGHLFYRFYNTNMELIGSREFASAEDPDVLGLIFALKGDTLLTARSRPLPKVELWLVE